MDIPIIDKKSFELIMNLKNSVDENTSTISKRVEEVHTLFHHELSIDEQLLLTFLFMKEPCKSIAALIDQAFYVGFSKGYQKCIDESLELSNLDK